MENFLQNLNENKRVPNSQILRETLNQLAAHNGRE